MKTPQLKDLAELASVCTSISGVGIKAPKELPFGLKFRGPGEIDLPMSIGEVTVPLLAYQAGSLTAFAVSDAPQVAYESFRPSELDRDVEMEVL